MISFQKIWCALGYHEWEPIDSRLFHLKQDYGNPVHVKASKCVCCEKRDLVECFVSCQYRNSDIKTEKEIWAEVNK